MKDIRNFSIIAHIDYGKSTLSDRIIQICGDLSDREMEAQALDSMDLERERGITTGAQGVVLDFKASDGETHQLNSIDTPGHVDFSYEVSHSLVSCEDALLTVGAGQGIEAQTLADCYIVMEVDPEVVSVLNKIDLPAADPECVAEEIEDIVGIDVVGIVCCSTKTSVGTTDVLERLVRDTPSPEGDPGGPLQALIIDSQFDNYLDTVSLVRIKNGTMCKGDKIRIMSTGQVYNADRLGIFTPKQIGRTELKCGEVGLLVCAIKDIFGVPVGDTLTQAHNPIDKPLSSFREVKPQAYASLFPASSGDYEGLRDVLGELSLNGAPLFYEPESSTALGFGFRCGFLGLLHIGITQERLECKYDLDLIATAPTIVYEVETTAKKTIYVDSPSKLPPLNSIYELHEPIAECHMPLSQAYLGDVITLYTEERGVQTNAVYHSNQVALTYEILMTEVVLDFFDRPRSTPRSYASLDCNFKRFQASDMVRADAFINNECADTLALITHRDNSQSRDRKLVEKMKGLIPRQQLSTAIQAAVGIHTTTRSTVKQLRKNVLVECYGSDASRKKELLQKQKEGKKRMKQIGSVELPQGASLAILHVDKGSK